MKVLTEQVAEAIDGRRVRSVVFTTFSFDPGFFELNILPVLFDQPFSQPDKVRRVQLEDALRTVDHLAVYYDRRALAQDGEPAQMDYRRLDVSRRTGYFHPKVILLLVDEHHEAGGEAADDGSDAEPSRQALVVGILSANLTRAGWWENVECAHIEEIKDRDINDERCSFRLDLLSLIRRVRRSAADADDQSALDEINAFLLRRTQRDSFGKNKSGGTYHPRIFGGQSQKTLSDWLRQLYLDRQDLNLEVISPYFDAQDEGPLRDLADALRPREIRVYLPTELNGASRVTKATYEAIAALDGTRWAYLPGEVVKHGRDDTSERLAPGPVCTPRYNRVWKRGGHDLLLVGSPNLTRAGHSHGTAGNLEAAFFVDITDAGYHLRWLVGAPEPRRQTGRIATSTEAEGSMWSGSISVFSSIGGRSGLAIASTNQRGWIQGADRGWTALGNGERTATRSLNGARIRSLESSGRVAAFDQFPPRRASRSAMARPRAGGKYGASPVVADAADS